MSWGGGAEELRLPGPVGGDYCLSVFVVVDTSTVCLSVCETV